MDVLNTAVACMAGLVLLMSLFTRWLRQYWISEPLLALLLGIAIAPLGLGGRVV